MFMTENIFFNKNNKKEILLVILYSNMALKTPLVPFQSGSPIIISGPTGSGKTYWTHKLLSNEMFTEHVSSILYCYGVYQITLIR